MNLTKDRRKNQCIRVYVYVCMCMCSYTCMLECIQEETESEIHESTEEHTSIKKQFCYESVHPIQGCQFPKREGLKSATFELEIHHQLLTLGK